jgi:hypothetical protein
MRALTLLAGLDPGMIPSTEVSSNLQLEREIPMAQSALFGDPPKEPE